MSIQSYNLKELWVRSDTVTAFLSPFKAVLAQREPSPFTRRDMELRERVFEIYTCDRPTPFLVSSEPRFEVAEDEDRKKNSLAPRKKGETSPRLT